MSNYAGVFNLNSPNNPWNKAFDLVKSNSSVLDVGCSSGNFGEALMQHKNCIVDGVEPDIGDAKQAAKKLRKVATSFVEEALKDAFKNRKYDHIIFLDVIEHLYDPAAVLRLLKDHLNPQGSIIFSIPNMAHISVRIMLLGGDFDYGETGLLDKTHLHFYTQEEIDRVFNEAGFSVNKWGFTEATYPRGVLVEQLSKVGIEKPTKELLNVLSSDSSKIFQYIGSAQVTSKTLKAKRKHYSPNPQGAITKWHEEREAILRKDVLNLDTEVTRLVNELADNHNHIAHQNALLENVPGLVERIRLNQYVYWYLRSKLRRVKRLFGGLK